MSSLENPHGFIHAKTPLVMELQSKHQWRSQYEASKQSDRLVMTNETGFCLIYCINEMVLNINDGGNVVFLGAEGGDLLHGCMVRTLQIYRTVC